LLKLQVDMLLHRSTNNMRGREKSDGGKERERERKRERDRERERELGGESNMTTCRT
jgi:hypothetical protein